MKYTKDFVVVYVADSIHAINIEVRNRKSPEKAKEVASKLGDEILQEVKTLADKKFSSAELARIHYAKWEELLTSEFREKIKFLHDKYKNDVSFRNSIIELIDSFTKNENRIFSYEDKVKLGTYVIEEFPEILARTPIGGLVFDACTYPFDGKLPELVDNIQKGIIFPEIRAKVIDTEPKVFLEVRK